MNSVRLLVIFLLALVCWLPGVSHAQSQNLGIYNWDEEREAWVLLYSGYEEAYESEALGDGDYLVDPVPYAEGNGGGGGDVVIIQKNRRSNLTAVTEEAEEPKEMERVVVTGVKPPMLGGSMLSVFWRSSEVGELYGQRSASKKAVPAPKGTYQVRCSDDVAGKSEAAMHVASRYGMKPIYSQTRRQLTIDWRNGTVETYENVGRASTMWMVPVPGTCREGS